MRIKDGADIKGLDIRVRPALIEAERIWKAHGREEGVTITSGLDGVHSAGSLHYYGLAVDFRNRYWDHGTKREVFEELKRSLKRRSSHFDIIFHETHIHVEFDPRL